jgi:hypothetical protein
MAVRESAVRRKCRNFAEHVVERIFALDESQFAHAGCIDEPAALGKPVHRSGCRGMTPTLIFFTNFAGLLGRSRQRIDERGLTHAGRTDQSDRLADAAPRPQPVHILRRAGIHGFDQQAVAESPRACDIRSHRIDRIGLGNHNYWKSPGLVSDDQVALQPRNVEVPVGGGHDEHRVDVGCDQLDRTGSTCGASLERTEAFEHAAEPRSLAIDQNPVSDRQPECRAVAG